MEMTPLVEEEPVFVEVQVCDQVRIATEAAATASSKPIPDFLEDILIAYLAKSGYLSDPVKIN